MNDSTRIIIEVANDVAMELSGLLDYVNGCGFAADALTETLERALEDVHIILSNLEDDR